MIWNTYPYTDFHELNLDWCIHAIKLLQKAWEDFYAGNKITFADPLLHDLTATYAKNTVVLDGDGNAYISLQAVPQGVQLSNGDYWLMVFNFEAYTEKANKNFTDHYYRDTDSAPEALVVGDWVVLDDVLYKVTAPISQGELFVIGTNLVHFTIEQFLADFITYINNIVQQYKNDIDYSEVLYRNQLAQDIADTTNSLQAQLDAAIAGVTVDSEVINARIGADGVTYSTLGEAIRTQIGDITVKTDEIETFVNVITNTEYTNIDTGYYYSNAYLTKIANSGYDAWPAIQLEANTTYTANYDIRSNFSYVARSGYSNEKLGSLSEYNFVTNPDGSLTFTTTSDVPTLYLTTGYYHTFGLTIVKGDHTNMDFFKGKVSVFNNLMNGVGYVTHHLYVDGTFSNTEEGIDVSKFKKLVHAVTRASDASETNRYVIHLASGTYDVISELGGATYIANLDPNDGQRQGIVLPDYVDIIGEGNPIITGVTAAADATVNLTNCFSPLNFWRHNKLKNLTIIAQNARYCCHVESNNAYTNMDIVIENCRLVHKGNNVTGGWTSTQAFGGGSGSAAHFYIKDSYFESAQTQGFSLHTNSNQKSNLLTIEGCRFVGVGTNPGIVLFSVGTGSENGYCYYKSSKATPGTLEDWTGTGTTKTWNIYNYVDNDFQILDTY